MSVLCCRTSLDVLRLPIGAVSKVGGSAGFRRTSFRRPNAALGLQVTRSTILGKLIDARIPRTKKPQTMPGL